VWRAGANDNTTIEFTDPVTVDGHPLPAGRYGVHMIAAPSAFTVIFSKNSTSWGSFSYDPQEDALRIAVKPAAGPFKEALTYEFSDLKPDGATIALEWDTVVVPFAIGVDTKSITLASLRREMRHLPGYKAETYFEAALYCLDNAFNYDEALKWIDQAIAQDENFDNLDLKAQILERTDTRDEAAALEARALKMASPQQLFGYGDRLVREKHLEEAKTFFSKITREHPEAWMNWYGLAKAQSALGDRDGAKKTLETSEKYARTPQYQAALKRLLARLAAGQGIGF
jgi:tetratricopeptide (TPR) repeat protein